MSSSADVLFKLLRIAFGTEADLSLPFDVDWKEVINLSIKQGVVAIAVDGLQRIYDTVANEESGMRNYSQLLGLSPQLWRS